MALWVIVPVKPLQRAKSRLSSVLTKEQRIALGRSLLVHTLAVLPEVRGITQTLVVSGDTAVLSLAREWGAKTFAERGNPHLNHALHRATAVVKGYGATSVLVLPADLPLMTTEEVQALLDRAVPPPVVVMVPDHRGTGTNALLSSPPSLIPYSFGLDSFARHRSAAEASGARVEVCHLAGIEMDLDLPEDLEHLRLEHPDAPLFQESWGGVQR